MAKHGERGRESLLKFYAKELAEAYEDARQRIASPVMLLIDADDSLGRALCEQHQLKDTISFLALPLEDALELFERSGELDPRSVGVAEQLLASARGEALRVIVVAFEGATFRTVPL